MGASNLTLTESLDALRVRWPFVSDVLGGHYAVWLGSGISRERFPDLGTLLRELLEILHSRIQAGDANCPYRRCLENVIQLTTIRPRNLLDEPPANWSNDRGELVAEEIVNQLWSRYPDVLDQTLRVNGETLTVTFHLLKLDEIYGDASKQPDAEHRFLALLIAEGILDELVTTNWDALIEAAHEACGNGVDRRLDVVAAGEDIDGTGVAGIARLTKIHGCARKSLAEPHRYRQHILATRTDITSWGHRPEVAPLRDMVHQLLRERPALFIGLSGQDWNLQSECFAAFAPVPPMANKRPRVIFSTPNLDAPQKAFLKVIYPANDYATNEERLTTDAALPLRGKPLLGTLYLLTLLLKAREFVNRGSQDLSKPWCDFIEQARKTWQSFLQQRYDAATDPNDSHQAWRQLADELPNVATRFVTIYRNLTTLSSPTAYRALDNRHLGLLKSESTVPELNYHWLMLVLAVLKEGWAQNLWSLGLALGQETRHGQFVLSLSGRDLSVFIVRDGANSLSRMIQDQIVDMRHAANLVVIYPADREPARRSVGTPSHARTRRSLSANRFPNRTPRSGPLEIWMRDRVDAHAQPATLLHALQQEMQSS